MSRLPFASYNGPMLALWGGPKQAVALERLHPTAICAVPWIDGELDDWARTHQAKELLTGATPASETVPPVIVGAVLGMSRSGNVLHPNDLRSTVANLKLLAVAGVSIEPAAIQAEAIRQGWEPDGARRLRDLAEKVAAGRTVQGAPKPTKKEAREAITRWEAAGLEATAGGGAVESGEGDLDSDSPPT